MDEPNPNDLWVVSIRNQDQNALEELRVHLYNFLRSRETPITLIDDILQVSIMKIINNINSFRGDSKFLSWCMGVTKNTATDLLRKEARLDRADTKYMLSYNLDGKFMGIELVEAIDGVHQLIEQGFLSERDWNMFCCYHYGGYSSQEVADEFELGITTVYKIISNVKKVLREHG